MNLFGTGLPKINRVLEQLVAEAWLMKQARGPRRAGNTASIDS